MSALEAEVRGVNKDGLLWGACELSICYHILTQSALLYQ